MSWSFRIRCHGDFEDQYAEHHAVVAIDTGAVLVGDLPTRALKLVGEWAMLHRAELEPLADPDFFAQVHVDDELGNMASPRRT